MSECPYKVGDKIEVGAGVELEFTGLYGDTEGKVFGAILSHPKGETRCEGSVNWDLPGQRIKPVWSVKSWTPFDASPSFLCHCGFHGFIHGGKWVSA